MTVVMPLAQLAEMHGAQDKRFADLAAERDALRAALDAEKAETKRVRKLWHDLMVECGEENCHMKAIDNVQSLRAHLDTEMERGDKLDAALIDLNLDLDKARAKAAELQSVVTAANVERNEMAERIMTLMNHVAELEAAHDYLCADSDMLAAERRRVYARCAEIAREAESRAARDPSLPWSLGLGIARAIEADAEKEANT